MFSFFCFVEERKLNDNEHPLYVQLNWGKDDREGRFLLKREDDKTANVCTTIHLYRNGYLISMEE